MMAERDDPTERALGLMGQTLQVEYRFIIHYPRLKEMLPDEESRRIIQVLGEDSTRHADIVARAMRDLGGTPLFPSLEPLPDLSVREVLQRQLEYERLALMLHTEAAGLVGDEWREHLQRIAEQERWHIEGMEMVLKRLGEKVAGEGNDRA
jgi:bacterioferritin (cytochrome b1)